MKNKLLIILLFLAVTLTNTTCDKFQIQPNELRSFVNYWWEPLYEEADYGIALENAYGGYICLIIQDDNNAFIKSAKYGVEGPYDWCINDDGSISIDDYILEVEPSGNDAYHIKIKNGLVPIDGIFIECYSASFDNKGSFKGSMNKFLCDHNESA